MLLRLTKSCEYSEQVSRNCGYLPGNLEVTFEFSRHSHNSIVHQSLCVVLVQNKYIRSIVSGLRTVTESEPNDPRDLK